MLIRANVVIVEIFLGILALACGSLPEKVTLTRGREGIAAGRVVGVLRYKGKIIDVRAVNVALEGLAYLSYKANLKSLYVAVKEDNMAVAAYV